MPAFVQNQDVMQIILERKLPEQIEADALIVPVFEGQKDARFGAGELFDSGEITGKPLEMTLLHHRMWRRNGCCW